VPDLQCRAPFPRLPHSPTPTPLHPVQQQQRLHRLLVMPDPGVFVCARSLRRDPLETCDPWPTPRIPSIPAPLGLPEPRLTVWTSPVEPENALEVREQHLDLLAVAARVRERFCFGEFASYIACGLVHVTDDPSCRHVRAALRLDRARPALLLERHPLERTPSTSANPPRFSTQGNRGNS
jgi:hypothetical protein